MKLNTKIWRRISKGLFMILTLIAFLTITPQKSYMLTGLSVTLIITLLFRTVFCGWVCPLGTLFDLIRGLGKGFGNLALFKPINRKYRGWIKSNLPALTKLDRYARYLRYALLLWILQAAFLGIASIKHSDERGIVSVSYLVITLAIIGLFVERSWCKYSCPVGAVMGIFSKLSPTSVTRNAASCIECNLCSRTCPMNINVAHLQSVREIDCQTCVKCVDACPVENTLELKFKIPRFKQIELQRENAVQHGLEK